jgi:hypothetical protein
MGRTTGDTRGVRCIKGKEEEKNGNAVENRKESFLVEFQRTCSSSYY